MHEGIAGRTGSPRYEDAHILFAPNQSRGDFCTMLPVTNATSGQPYNQVECSCGTRHVRTQEFNNFECSKCGRRYIWGNHRNGNETFPRS